MEHNPSDKSITHYEVRYRTAAIRIGDTIIAPGDWTLYPKKITDLSVKITGMTNDIPYDVQVRAVNAAGPGPWSDMSAGTPRE